MACVLNCCGRVVWALAPHSHHTTPHWLKIHIFLTTKMEDSILAKCEWGGVRCEWGVCVRTTQHINICQSARCVCLSAVWGRKWNLSSHKATPKELVLTVRLGQSRCLPRAVTLFAYDSLGGVLDVSVKSSSFFLNICSYHIVQLLSYIFE